MCPAYLPCRHIKGKVTEDYSSISVSKKKLDFFDIFSLKFYSESMINFSIRLKNVAKKKATMCAGISDSFLESRRIR